MTFSGSDTPVSKLTGTVQGIQPVEGMYLATIRGNGADCTIATAKEKDIDRLRRAMAKGTAITLRLLPFEGSQLPAGSTIRADNLLHSVQTP